MFYREVIQHVQINTSTLDDDVSSSSQNNHHDERNTKETYTTTTSIHAYPSIYHLMIIQTSIMPPLMKIFALLILSCYSTSAFVHPGTKRSNVICNSRNEQCESKNIFYQQPLFVHPRTNVVQLHNAASSSSNTDEKPSDAACSSQHDTSDEKPTLLESIQQMRVKEIKKELDDAGISSSDCFEKSELVQRLYDYKVQQPTSEKQSNNVTQKKDQNANRSKSSKGVIRVPMEFHSLTTNSVPSKNNVYLRPSPGKFPAISVTLPSKNNKKLTLLVDTACSGLILRPNVASSLQLPKINAGVTLTAAGGSMNGSNNSVCSLDTMKLMDEDQTILKDFIVLAQDVGALPPVLDGIIGLSFLERFHSISFDFEKGELVLLNSGNKNKGTASIILEYENPMMYETLAETNLQRSRLGIYIAQTTLDGRGPVKMIVDSGAAATFLNWKGVGDLNMDRSHPLISYNSEAIGIMGADNNALALSHRFVLKRRINFASSNGSNLGMFAPGLEIDNDDNGAVDSVNVDIGDLPVLQQMRSEDVGGILGNDILMRCDVVHFDNLKDLSSLKLSLLRRRKDDESYY